jgi:hypothetical protein
MIDTTAEKLIPLKRANDFSPVAVHAATWHRWALRGAKGVKLSVVHVGHRIFTSREAIGRFLDATNAGGHASEQPTPKPPRTPNTRAAAASKARKQLASMGVGRR